MADDNPTTTAAPKKKRVSVLNFTITGRIVVPNDDDGTKTAGVYAMIAGIAASLKGAGGDKVEHKVIPGSTAI